MDNKQSIQLQNERLIFNGQTHFVVGVLAAASSSIPLDIAIADVQLDEPTQEEIDHKVAIALPRTAPTADILGDRMEILVYIYKGRFYPLTGRDRIRYYRAEGRTHFKAKIVSSPALKKCREVVQEDMGSINVQFYQPPSKLPAARNFDKVSDAMDAYPQRRINKPMRYNSPSASYRKRKTAYD